MLTLARFMTYIALILQGALLAYVLDLYNEHGFSAKNVRSAFRAGCQIGHNMSLDQSAIERCDMLADMFYSSLTVEVNF